MANERLTYEKVLTAFQGYLAKDDLVEIIQTSRGYAIIAWDDQIDSWVQIEHCSSPEDMKEILLAYMTAFLESGFTGGTRELTEAERASIAKQKDTLSI